MKRILLTLMACLAIHLMHAQTFAVPWSIWLSDQLTKQALAGATVSATVDLMDKDGNVIYSEMHSGTANALGNFVFKVGQGTPLSGSIDPMRYKDVEKLAYLLQVSHNGNDKTLQGMEEVGAAAKANVASFACTAGIANNALALFGWNVIVVPITWVDILCPDDPDLFDYYPVLRREDLSRSGESSLVTAPLRSFVRQDRALHINDGEEVDYIRVGAGFGKAMYCGPDPENISAFHGIRMPNLAGLNYGVGLWVDDYESPSINYALAAYNANALGIAIRAFGLNAGLSSFGTTGVFGQSIGTGYGSAVYGYVDEQPEPGPDAYKYALAAYAGTGLSFVYAAALFGTSFTTGPIMTMSDERLKTEIRTTENALSRITALRPTSYRYAQDMPYGFPEGVQHGFLAQEFEQTFPELVGDVVIPNSLEMEKMGNNGAQTFRGIHYEGLIPVLTAAIQELHVTVEQQDAEIVMLKDALKKLEARVAEIEK